MSFRSDFFDGARAIAPLLPAGATVGLVTGVAATAVGLEPGQALSMSVIVYSPTVMLASFELLDSGAPLIVLVVGALVVGVRFSMLSLSISSYFARVSTHVKWVLAYFLWTPTYALAIERYEADPGTSRSGYYLGTAVPLWVTVQAAFVAGAWFGTSVPPSWQLRFVVPLAFIALLMRFLTDRGALVAALVAGGLAVGGASLPLESGLIVAAIGGTVAGVLTRRGAPPENGPEEGD